jgi:uncharacterized membrane protein YidH (DUF202 family)
MNKKLTFKRCRDLILGIVLLALGIAYTVMAQNIKQGNKLVQRNVGTYAHARIVPTLLGVLLIVLAVLLIVQGIKRFRKEDNEPAKKMDKVDMISVLLTFAAMILYIIILPELGFILSTILYLFCQITILAPKEKRNLLLFIIVAVVFTAIAFVAFRIGLTQMLPRGPIEALLGY